MRTQCMEAFGKFVRRNNFVIQFSVLSPFIIIIILYDFERETTFQRFSDFHSLILFW